MQQNDIYNIPLPRDPGAKNQKKKQNGNERGINYPCGLKKNAGFFTGTQNIYSEW
jgi:hypothetical protein